MIANATEQISGGKDSCPIVARDEAGNFVAGWKLGADQVENLYRSGNVQ